MSDIEDLSIDSISDFEDEDNSDIDNIDDIQINNKNTKSSKKKNKNDDLDDLDYSENSESDEDIDEEDDEDNEEEEDGDDEDDENDDEDNTDTEKQDDSDEDNDDIENFENYADSEYYNEDDEQIQTKIINDEETILTTKSENKIIDKNKYISRPFLTIYEYTKILCKRTTQILNGAKVMLNIPEDEINNYTAKELAILELKYKVSPFKIIRTIGAHNIEIWDVNELQNNL